MHADCEVLSLCNRSYGEKENTCPSLREVRVARDGKGCPEIGERQHYVTNTIIDVVIK